VAYLDCVVIMGRRLQDAKEVFILLFEQTNKMELEINKKRQNLLHSHFSLTVNMVSIDPRHFRMKT
jgi:hypothetical protein